MSTVMVSDSLRQDLTTIARRVLSDEGRAELLNVPENLLDAAGDLNTIFGLVRTISDAYLNKKAERFVRGMASDTVTLGPDEVAERLRNDRVAVLIATTINDAIFAQSLDAVAVLGMIAGGLITRKQGVGYRDQVAIAALRIMFDDDLENFVRIVTYVRGNLGGDINSENFSVKTILDKIDPGATPFEYELTFEKLKSVQAVKTGNIADGFSIGIPSPWGKVGLTSISDHLYDLIIEAMARNLVNLRARNPF